MAGCFWLCACQEPAISDEEDIIQILLNNYYAVQFDDMWEVLDMYYPFFDYMDADFDSLRITTIKRMKNVSSDKQFASVVQQFCREMGEPDIYFTAGDSLYKGYSIATQDCQALQAGERGSFASYSASGNSNILTEWCAFNTLLRSTNDSTRVYGLMLPLYYPKYVSWEHIERLKEFVLSYPDIQGLVLDIRNRDIVTPAYRLVSCFYETGTHVVCTSTTRAAIDENIPLSQQRDSLGKAHEYRIVGNGLLSDIPIAIIVNEATTGEYAWLAHILAERDNVAIISRTYGGGGCESINTYYGNIQHIILPYSRSVTANYVCYEPLLPDIPVAWEGYELNHYDPNTEDMCIVAALDFIDKYNKNK